MSSPFRSQSVSQMQLGWQDAGTQHKCSLLHSIKLGIFEWLLWSDSCLVKQLILIFLSKRRNFCIFFPDKQVSLITIVTGFEEEWCVLCHSYLSVPASWMRAGVCHLGSSLITRKMKDKYSSLPPWWNYVAGAASFLFPSFASATHSWIMESTWHVLILGFCLYLLC